MLVHDGFFCLNQHSLVKHKITMLRDKKTASKDFGVLLEELTLLLASKALENLSFKNKTVETPLGVYSGIETHAVVLVPIIRAGLAMMPPLQRFLQNVKVGFLGIARNHETLAAEEYYKNIPAIQDDETVIILDPMLATGNTMEHTIKVLQEKGAKKIIILAVLATPMAVKKILNISPESAIYCADIDEKLDENGYIVPGLGDAGDRVFNT